MDGWLFAGITTLCQDWDKPTNQRYASNDLPCPNQHGNTSNGGATILVPGWACRWLGTVDVGIPPPIVHHLHVPLSLSLSTQYVGPLRCVALFNQKHASPRLGQMIPRVAGGRTDGIYHCFAAPIHTIAGRITGPNAIESIPPPSVTVCTYCQVLHTTKDT